MTRRRMKYYVLNKRMDYDKGFYNHMTYRDGGVWNDGNTEGQCSFISGLYDGREPGCVWHRLKLGLHDAAVPMTLAVYASDSPYIFIDDLPVPIETIIRSEDIQMDMQHKLEIFEPYCRIKVPVSQSILLHEVSGKYMWFIVSAYCPMGETAGFDGGVVYFPKRTWMEYLPDIYSQGIEENPFLERYLSIFQTLYDDLGEKIDSCPEFLDAASADTRQLRQLADWLDIGCLEVWNEKQLRYLVANAHRLYRLRGTKEGICEFVKLYTGETPLVAEQHQIENFSGNEALYGLLRNLYGDNPGVFTILLRAACLPTEKEISDIQKIVEHIRPAWMDFKLVILRPYILLDSYSYLGINSSLSQYRPAELNGMSMLSFTVVGNTE